MLTFPFRKATPYYPTEGYIIAGLGTQLSSPKMKNDFRILCDSLKNVDVILNDDLLESLDTFVNRTANIKET